MLYYPPCFALVSGGKDSLAAAQVLAGVIRDCRQNGVDFALARLESPRAHDALVRFGIDALLGPDHQFRSVEEAIRSRGKKPPHQ